MHTESEACMGAAQGSGHQPCCRHNRGWFVCGVLSCLAATALETLATWPFACAEALGDASPGGAGACVAAVARTDRSSLLLAVAGYGALSTLALASLAARQLDLVGRGTTEARLSEHGRWNGLASLQSAVRPVPSSQPPRTFAVRRAAACTLGPAAVAAARLPRVAAECSRLPQRQGRGRTARHRIAAGQRERGRGMMPAEHRFTPQGQWRVPGVFFRLARIFFFHFRFNE